MKDHMDSVWQLVRYGLLWIGSMLTTRGVVSNSEWDLVVGAIMTLLPVGWGVFVRWNTKAVPAATAARPDVPTVSPVTGQVKH